MFLATKALIKPATRTARYSCPVMASTHARVRAGIDTWSYVAVADRGQRHETVVDEDITAVIRLFHLLPYRIAKLK